MKFAVPMQALSFALFAAAATAAVAQESTLAPSLAGAESLYNRTEYQASLKLLNALPAPGAAAFSLMGRNYFRLGDYKKAGDAFQKAVDLEPANSEYVHWLGRTFGRRAESASPLLAPVNAGKARQYFERAVALDPANREALNDLFDYYLQAPGFLGGGLEKAAAIAAKIGALDPAEGLFAQAQLAERKKQYDDAERQLRHAMELAPRQVGRIVDLARYLAKRGRYQESDAVFEQAEKLAPGAPKVIFARANALIQNRRNLDQAKALLERYLRSNLRPEDPPRQAAEKLLKQAAGA